MKDFGIKTSLQLILVFLVIIVLGTVAGACLYMVYMACTMLVAGESLAAFSVSLFIRGLFVSFPICITASGMLLVLYLIRHPAFPMIPIIIYALLISAAWLFLVPLSGKLSERYNTKVNEPQSPKIVSPGFFRHDGEYIFYYSKLSYENKADGLCIDNANNKVYTYTGIQLAPKKEGFSDSLIEETVAMPKLIKILVSGTKILENTAVSFYHKGYSWWLCFLSFGLALLSVIGLRRISGWRLLNTFIVIFATAGIFAFNALYYGTSVFGKVALFCNDWFKQTSFIHEPFIVICNVFTSLLFLLWGLCLDIFKKNKELDEEGNPA
jgi:hypothetical protein